MKHYLGLTIALLLGALVFSLLKYAIFGKWMDADVIIVTFLMAFILDYYERRKQKGTK